MRAAGYDVVGVGSGNAALAELRSSRFDLLVLDLDMPDVDGFEVLKTIRSEMPHLPVLVISGYLQGALLQAANCFGATSTLDKISAAESLVEVTRRLLG